MLIVGGSNSRMLAGYTASLADRLAQSGYPRDAIRNIAVGANTCLIGLQMLHATKDIAEQDIIVIEYAVNDHVMFMAGEEDLWRSAFEGLVRNLTRRWPNARIFNLMLGRGDVAAAVWERQLAENRRISERYRNVRLLDADAFVRERLPGRRMFHTDLLHYVLPIQGEVGRWVADEILASAPAVPEPLPAPLSSDVFDPVVVVDFPVMRPESLVTFSNSVVSVDAMRVKPGDDIVFEVDGPLISLSFVSAAGCGSLTLECGGDTVLIHTLHGGVRRGQYRFLPLSAYGDWWRQAPGRRTVRISPSTDARASDWPNFHVGPQERGSAAEIFLLTALVRATPAEAAP